MSDKVSYNGKEYTKEGGKWVDSKYCVAPNSVQNALNHLAFGKIDFDSMSVSELVEAGNEYKKSSTNNLAIKCYKKALEKTDSESLIKFILPSITSCLRKQGKADEVIEIFSEVKAKWGKKMLSAAALTSIAAAYCDLGEYENAKICCNKAYAMSQGKATGELNAVYGRIDKESQSKNFR